MTHPLLTIRSHSFHPRFLPSQPAIIDAGAHKGEFTLEFNRLFPETRAILIEGNPELNETLPDIRNAVVLNNVLAGRPGDTHLHLAENPEASSIRPLREGLSLESIPVRAVTLPEIFENRRIERLDLLKLDVEGAEIGILTDTPPEFLRRIGQITVEFHESTENLETAKHAEERNIRGVIERLRRLGFLCLNVSSPFCFDVLFLNRDLYGVGFLEASALRARSCWIPRVSWAIRRRFASHPKQP